MIDYHTALVVFAICMAGAAGTAFHLGRQEGIENTVQYLIDKGVLEVDDEEYQARATPEVAHFYNRRHRKSPSVPKGRNS